MANDDRILLRRTDGSGAGVIFKTRKEANEFLKNNDGYAEESADAPAKKSQGKAEDKAVDGPKAS